MNTCDYCDCCEFHTAQQDYWESLYNHKEICESITKEHLRVSKALFQSKVKYLLSLNKGPLTPETIYMLLTSLNRSLYDYCLFQKKLSFSKCCCQNRAYMTQVQDTPSLLQAGYSIIDSYAAALEAAQTGHTHIEKACAYIQSNLDEDLSLSQVSQEVFLSKSHLCHIFKTLMGTTFCDYVRQQRVEYARKLLATSTKSIDDISCACGFHSSTYFATVFKTEMGMSPSAFRRDFQSAS